MKQCPNCKCQIGSGVAVCPYCGVRVPIEEEYPNIQRKPWESAEDERTHVQYQRMYEDARTGPGYTTEPVIYSAIRQVPYYAPPYNNCMEREKNQSTVINVLAILIVCLVAANIFELVALLLCLR